MKRGTRARSVALGAAGPALIVLAVLVVLHDMAFGGAAPAQQNDVLGFWLPNHCLLGRSLAGGDIPEWNPHVLGGVPMAADPQSGWMYLPAMALYAALPCEAALPPFIVLQPVVAGLGLYGFLRSESLGRAAATAGGLAMALGIAASQMTVSLPVSGSLAWSAVLLLAASRIARAERWSARLAWAGAGALAWGQLAAAHFSHGLVIGTAAAGVYLIVQLSADVRGGRRSLRAAAGIAALFFGVLIPVNLAYLLPRIAYLPHSTLGQGYDALRVLTERLSGHTPPPIEPRADGGFSWPLTFATSPGAYLGGVPLTLAFAALWRRRPSRLAVTAAIIGAGCYVLSLPVVARFLAPVFLAIPYGDTYLHAPSRLRYGLVLALPVLGAAGLDAWLRRDDRSRLWLWALGVLLWGVVPLLVGVRPLFLVLAWAGIGLGGGLLLAAVRRPALIAAVPALLALELSVGALVGQEANNEVVTAPSPDEVAWHTPFENLLEPRIDAGAYVEPGPNAAAVSEGGRYLTLQPWRESRGKGYIARWMPGEEGLLDNQRAMLLGLEDAQGYNPVQPLRTWVVSRRLNRAPPKYNVTVYAEPDARVLDLWQVNWLVGPEDAPASGFVPVATETSWVVHRGPARPRASLFTSWTVVGGAGAALDAIAAPRFDATRSVVVEGDPGVRPTPDAAPGTAVYRTLGPEDAEVLIDSPTAAVLLVRNAFDRNWRATIDGSEVPVLKADYALQGVAIPPGRHVVRLRYRDPWVRAGLLGSAIAAAALGGAWAVARRRERAAR